MRNRLWPPVLLLGAAWLIAPRPARADAPPSAPEAKSAPAALVELTDASSVLYNFDNRDTRPGQVASVANDRWGLFYNRFNLQVTRGHLTLSLRADNAWFYTSPSPESLANRVDGHESISDAALRSAVHRDKLEEAGIELSNRYINWLYPAKYTVSYGTPDLELALGDSYAQFGRGFVLSVRKQDELSSDTTVRGVRAGVRLRAGSEARIKLTLLGGSLNPLRIDEASGRYLGVDSSVTPGFVALTEAGMPRAVATDFAPDATDCTRFGTCSYAPDRLIAGQLELSLSRVTLGSQASVLFRSATLGSDVVRTADRITTASQSFDVPSLGEHGSAYLETALQQLSHQGENEPSLPLGYALYGTASWVDSRFSLLAEGKHYRGFFPLSANVSSARAREFSLLQYSAPPTAEELWVDTEFGNFNTCVSGGRVKAEGHVSRAHSVFAWAGHYRSFAESASNDACDTSSRNENRIWDLAVGFDARPSGRRARWDVTTGTRFDDSERSVAGPDGPTHAFYRELYVRYDVSEPISSEFTLELQGVHRRRRETVGGPAEPWLEGQHSTGIDWGERLSVALGVEYDSRPDVPHGYLNGMLAYRPSNALSLSLFAGQRRGALRCVGGVCRIYPPFEGLRLDATLRY
ncbi:MAG TPA: hypothetical protein VG937_38335 [Polyangiaceae bacterium]|nr:hypothetical protein [Polyangiaceae bacterium]